MVRLSVWAAAGETAPFKHPRRALRYVALVTTVFGGRSAYKYAKGRSDDAAMEDAHGERGVQTRATQTRELAQRSR